MGVYFLLVSWHFRCSALLSCNPWNVTGNWHLPFVQGKRKTWELRSRVQQPTQGWSPWLSTLPSFPTQDGTHSTMSLRKCRTLRGKHMFFFWITGRQWQHKPLCICFWLEINLILIYQLYHTNESFTCTYVFYILHFNIQFLKKENVSLLKARKSKGASSPL